MSPQIPINYCRKSFHPIGRRFANPGQLEEKSVATPTDVAPSVESIKAAPSLSATEALKLTTSAALQTAAAIAPGTWMTYPASEDYKGRLDQDTTVSGLKDYAKKRLGSLPEKMPLGQVLAYTGASSLTDMTRNVGKYREKLDQLSQLGADFQGNLVVKKEDPQASLVVLPNAESAEGAKVSTFQDVVRNERARTGLINLLDSDRWKGQLEGSKLQKIRPQLEDPQVSVKDTLDRALGELEGGYTKAHMERAVETVGLPLAKEAGLNEKEQSTLKEVSGIYDIGKLAVNEEILDFEGKWPEAKAKDWFGQVSNHVHPEIVKPLIEAYALSPEAEQTVLHHHEKPNGWAYCEDANAPSWDNVPKTARVLGMADTVDAMQWKKANVNRPVEQKLDKSMMKKFLTGDAEKGKVDGSLVDLVFSRVLGDPTTSS